MAITIHAPAPAPPPLHSRSRTRKRHAQDSDTDSAGSSENEQNDFKRPKQAALDRQLGLLGLDLDGEGSAREDGRTKRKGARQGGPRRRAVITPGELITEDPSWMRGHGTTTSSTTTTNPHAITSTLLGTLTLTNRLLSLTPLRPSRYTPSIGDLTISRILTISPKRYTVSLNAPLTGSLPLSSINLPGGVLRRRTAIDELAVRSFFGEGDLVVAEVQSLRADGAALLHTRSLRYGKLRNGVGVQVGVGGVGRGGRRIFEVEGTRGARGVEVILAVNGFVWVCQPGGRNSNGNSNSNSHDKRNKNNDHNDDERNPTAADTDASMYTSQNDLITAPTRRQIAAVASLVTALAARRVLVDEASVRRGWDVAWELLQEEKEEDDDRMRDVGDENGNGNDEAGLAGRAVDVLVSEGDESERRTSAFDI